MLREKWGSDGSKEACRFAGWLPSACCLQALLVGLLELGTAKLAEPRRGLSQRR